MLSFYRGPDFTAGTTYKFSVAASDSQGNRSPASGSFVFAVYNYLGSISGPAPYGGSATGVVSVAALGKNVFREVELPSPGAYTLPQLPDGFYFGASFLHPSVQRAEISSPWAVYGNWTAATINGGQAATGKDMILVGGTFFNPIPWVAGNGNWITAALPGTSITVDGNAADWAGISPAATAPRVMCAVCRPSA